MEIRYRTETSTDPETGETTTEEVPYEYFILNIKLKNKPISELAPGLLTPEQLEMFRVYLETSGNKPLIFGGGSPDGNPSEDLSGVQLVNGMILSRLVDTFSSRILYPMLLLSGNHSIAAVLSWEEGLH